MSLHRVEFDYDEPSGGFMEIDLNPELDWAGKADIARSEVLESFPDAMNIMIVNIEEIV
jgi:hypothetical protein